jgi:succinyl-CoA synthetase beta subunit
MDIYDPFMTVLRATDDREVDPREEIAALMVRDALISELVSGSGYLDSTLDCLAEQGINPDAWLDATVANIDYVIESGIRFYSNDHGLFLPDHPHGYSSPPP